MREINNIKVITGKKGRRFTIKIKLDMLTDGNIADKTNSIQEMIKQRLSEKMGLEVEKVEVQNL